MDNQKDFIGQKIIFLECVDSTNNYTANLFKTNKVDSGAVILTDIQTSGRGQRGKEWQSDAFSNLIVSIAADLNLWKINDIISVNHITALALQSFLLKHTENVKIKWPNDIMINDKKAVGILIESQLSSTQRKSVIGFGVNINQHKFEVPRATSLGVETGKNYNPKTLIYEVIDAFNYWLNQYHQKGGQWIHEVYNQQLWKLNVEHEFISNKTQNGNQKSIGKIQKTTPEGALIVKFDDEEEIFRNGEVKY